MTVGEVFGDRLRAERRRFELFRKGLVVDVDTSVVPYIATISDGSQSRPMPYIDASIAVGDVVKWVDSSDPFAWAKTDPLLDGNFQEELTIRGATKSGSWVPSGDQTVFLGLPVADAGPVERVEFPGNPTLENPLWTGGIAVATSSLEQNTANVNIDYIDTSIQEDSGWNSPDGLAPPFVNPVAHFTDLEGFSLLTGDDLGETDLPGSHTHLSGSGVVFTIPFAPTWQNAQISVLREMASIVTAKPATSVTTVTGGVPTAFPTITAPGADWLIMVCAQVRPIAAFGPTIDFTIGPLGGVRDPQWSGFTSTDVRALGENGGTIFGFVRTWEAGDYTITVEPDATRDMALSAFLCNSRVETAT